MSVFNWTAPIFKFAGRRWTIDDFRGLSEPLKPHIPPQGVFADLGGGTGDLAVGLAEILQARAVVIDPTPQMLSRVDAHPLVSQSLASAEKLPFPDGYFDGLICSDAFHHVRDQRAAAAEIARVVRPGGVVLMLELEPSRLLVLFERLLGEPAAFLTRSQLQALLAEQGIRGDSTTQRVGYLFVGTVQPGPRTA